MRSIIAAHRKNKSGFTVMELVLVMTIMGIVVMVGLPAFRNLTSGWQADQCRTNRRRLQMVMQAEQVKHPEAVLLDVEEYQETYALECPGGGIWSIKRNADKMMISCDKCN